MINVTKAPLLHAVAELATRPGVVFWVWNKRHHWVFKPSQYKLSILHGLVEHGHPGADEKIREYVSQGYLDNDVDLFSEPRFDSLVYYLIKHHYFSADDALLQSLVYSNDLLARFIIRSFPIENMLACVIYAFQNYLWKAIDFLLLRYDPTINDLEFLLSQNSYNGLVHYMITKKKIEVGFDFMQLVAKYGNMYIFLKATQVSKEVVFPPVPNQDTLVLAAGSGNIYLVRCLIEQYKIEPEMIALQNAANHYVLHYFLDTLQIPVYDGVFEIICERGILDSVKFFLEEKNIIPDFDICAISARSGNVNLLRYLITHGFQTRISSLEEASRNGHLDLFKYLSIEQKIEISAKIGILAFRSGNINMIRYIVQDLGYLPNIECLKSVAESGSTDGFLYLMNMSNISFNLNSLHSACIGGNVDILSYLMEKFDLQPDILCLNEAIKRGHDKIFLFIHKFHNHIFLEANSETLIAAIEGKQLKFIEFLLPLQEYGLESLNLDYKDLINQGLQKITNNLKRLNGRKDDKDTAKNDENDDFEQDHDIPIGTDQTYDNSIMKENPLVVDDTIMTKVFIHGTPEIVQYFMEIKDSWLQFIDLAYVSGNLPLVKYLIEARNIEPIPHHLKVAAASGNVELLKYLSIEQNLELLEDSLDFACILGKINPILFYAKQLKVDNLLIDLAHECENPKLEEMLLGSFKPVKLGYIEYYRRRHEAHAFKKFYQNLK